MPWVHEDRLPTPARLPPLYIQIVLLSSCLCIGAMEVVGRLRCLLGNYSPLSSGPTLYYFLLANVSHLVFVPFGLPQAHNFVPLGLGPAHVFVPLGRAHDFRFALYVS